MSYEDFEKQQKDDTPLEKNRFVTSEYNKEVICINRFPMKTFILSLCKDKIKHSL